MKAVAEESGHRHRQQSSRASIGRRMGAESIVRHHTGGIGGQGARHLASRSPCWGSQMIGSSVGGGGGFGRATSPPGMPVFFGKRRSPPPRPDRFCSAMVERHAVHLARANAEVFVLLVVGTPEPGAATALLRRCYDAREFPNTLADVACRWARQPDFDGYSSSDVAARAVQMSVPAAT